MANTNQRAITVLAAEAVHTLNHLVSWLTSTLERSSKDDLSENRSTGVAVLFPIRFIASVTAISQQLGLHKSKMSKDGSDIFELYDLHVEVICPPGERIMCGAKEGDHFTLEGEMLYLPPGQGLSIYSLGAVLPLLAAKQRMTHSNDWMSTDADVACPDPNCKSRLRISRIGKRSFSHGEVTVVPLHVKSSKDTKN